MVMDGDSFGFFIPAEALQKSTTADGKRWIQGIASTSDKDLQDETIVQHGLDYSYFLKFGYINDDHKAGPENKVGEPTEARITPAGFWIKAFLYKGMERAEYWWSFLTGLEASGATRKAGFSVQGKVERRQGSSILKCWIQDVAITASPVNTHTYAELVKSLKTEKWCKHPWKSLEKACKGCPGTCPTAKHPEEEKKALTTAGGRSLIPQSLEGTAKVLTYKSQDAGFSYPEAVSYLIQRGYAPLTAKAVAKSIFQMEQGKMEAKNG